VAAADTRNCCLSTTVCADAPTERLNHLASAVRAVSTVLEPFGSCPFNGELIPGERCHPTRERAERKGLVIGDDQVIAFEWALRFSLARSVASKEIDQVTTGGHNGIGNTRSGSAEGDVGQGARVLLRCNRAGGG